MYIILCTRRYAVDRWPDSLCKQTTTVCIFHNLVIIILMDPRSDSTLNYLVSHSSFLYLPLIHISVPHLLFYSGSDCLLFRKKIRKGTPPIFSTPVSAIALLLLNAPCFLYMHRKSSYIYAFRHFKHTWVFNLINSDKTEHFPSRAGIGSSEWFCICSNYLSVVLKEMSRPFHP